MHGLVIPLEFVPDEASGEWKVNFFWSKRLEEKSHQKNMKTFGKAITKC